MSKEVSQGFEHVRGKWLLEHFMCPNCGNTDLKEQKDWLECCNCGSRFPIIDHRPVMLESCNQLFSTDVLCDALLVQSGRKARSIYEKCIPALSLNLARDRCLRQYKEMLGGEQVVYVLVVGSGRQRDLLDKAFEQAYNIELVYCDIDACASVDCYCDAHALPFRNGSFDGVITTAVLEHVLYPEKVAEEIARVVTDGGLLYSEVPFMQQVHEGA